MVKVGKILIIGGGIAGMEASLNLVEAGFKVYLVEEAANIGGKMAQLDKTFPTNDCSMCIMAPKLVEVGRNPNIELMTLTRVKGLEGQPGNFRVTLERQPRRILNEKCTSCGACAPYCPIEVESNYNEELSNRSAAYINFPQAIPSTYSIDREMAPCVDRCPINLNARDYVGLVAEGKFLEALDVIRDRLPFPGVIGRICSHPCEDACLRGRKVDEPISICALKRFVADYEVGRREPWTPDVGTDNGKHVAVVGGGPSGMTCAIELRKAGCNVTIFEATDRLGGMLFWGIPAYRLPREVLEREISLVERMGVEIRYGTRLGKDVTLNHLRETYDAVYVGVGAQAGRMIGLPDENAKGVTSGVDFLRAVNGNRAPEVGRNAVVVGGGSVAIDAALALSKLGAEKVTIVCLEKRDEMPASLQEIAQAEEEGVRIVTSWGPAKIHTRAGAVTGIEFKRCTSALDEAGRFSPRYNEGVRYLLDSDMLVFSIGQAVEPIDSDSVVSMLDTSPGGWIKADTLTLETGIPGVFAGGDAATGPKTAIDAIHQGQEAAESILRFLIGKDLKEDRYTRETKVVDTVPEGLELCPRAESPKRPVDQRRGFEEVELALDEETARAEAERCMSCRRCLGCKLCEEACKPQAIDYSQGPTEMNIEVGSILLAAGLDEYDANLRPELGYGIYRNVLTSTEFERILSATGPTMSMVMRPSDGKIPKKIAWLQCVGSRDKENGYCSSVCCMYATKEAIIAKEHQHDIEATIFAIDVRAFGKGFDQYYERARTEYGVRYIKSSISRVLEDPETSDLDLTYVGEDGLIKSERFDLVVLSVGMRPSRSVGPLAKVLGIDLNAQGFVRSDPVNPILTSRPGIFVAGALESPKDIPETVVQASGAACEAGSIVAEERGKALTIKELPEETDAAGADARIGVFVCDCGVNIAGVVNVPEVVAYARTLPNVKVADENLFTCSQDTQEKMKRIIKEDDLNRIVVASCSPRTHEFLFRTTIREAGLNKYLFEMANIRDQCSWVHMTDRDGATEKAKTLVRMAVTNANHIRPLKEISVDVTKRALVVGGGIAGLTAALKLADQNFEVYLIERDTVLGGNARRIFRTIDGEDVQALLKNLTDRVDGHPLIHAMTGANVTGHAGFKGNFETEIKQAMNGVGTARTIRHGVLITATGGEELKPAGVYGYGEDEKVLTQMELEGRMAEGKLQPIKRTVMIQCVGSRNHERPYCSRICCSTAVKNALRLKEKQPDMDVVILYRDMMTYGFLEEHYLRARRAGVRFIRFEKERPPVLTRANGRLQIACFDPSITESVTLDADLLVLSAAVIPRENDALAGILKTPRTNEGFFLEAHAKLRPVDFATEGIFLCGLAHAPKSIRETVAQAEAAVGRALTVLAKDRLALGGVVAEVDGEKCAACLSCVRVCPYNVPIVNTRGEAEIDVSKCKGCGTCVSECPAKAIELMHYRDIQLVEKTCALLAKGAE
jgi:heterodisulfide reductase subunit A-like polyferredoxin